jgi:hypothetical protein
VSAGFVVFFRQKVAPQRGPHAEQPEVISGDQFRGDHLPAVAGAKLGIDGRVGDDPVRQERVCAERFVKGPADVCVDPLAARIRRLNRPQFIRPEKGLRLEEQIIEQREQAEVDSDTERERKHGHGGEAGVLEQLAEGEP